jgi:hypothetical protein
MGPNQASMYVPTWVFVFWPKITLLKVLCGKTYQHDAKFTHPAKDMIFFDECAAVNIPKLKGRMCN